MRNQRFDTSQTLSERAELNRLQHGPRSRERAYIKRHHAAKTVLLSSRERVLRMGGRTRIINFLHFRMLFQKGCDRTPGFVMLLHPQREGLRAAQHEPRVKRR